MVFSNMYTYIEHPHLHGGIEKIKNMEILSNQKNTHRMFTNEMKHKQSLWPIYDET